MKSGVIGSLKFKRLKRLLQLPDYAICGVLESIWGLAVDQAKMGDVGRYSDDEIAAAIEWEGDAAKLVDALVESKWLDRSPFENVRLVIHDWFDHAPQFITRWIARQLGMTAGSAEQVKTQWLASVGLKSSDGYTKHASGLAVASQNVVGDDPYGRGSIQTKSIQTKPNQDPPTPKGEQRPLLPDDDREPKKKSKAPTEAELAAWRELSSKWNATEGVVRCTAGNESRRTSLRRRLKETVLLDGKPTPWLQAAIAALERKFPLKLYASDPEGWKPDIDFFLRPSTVMKIFEGKYDWSKNGKRERDSGAGQQFDPAATQSSGTGWRDPAEDQRAEAAVVSGSAG